MGGHATATTARSQAVSGSPWQQQDHEAQGLPWCHHHGAVLREAFLRRKVCFSTQNLSQGHCKAQRWCSKMSWWDNGGTASLEWARGGQMVMELPVLLVGSQAAAAPWIRAISHGGRAPTKIQAGPCSPPQSCLHLMPPSAASSPQLLPPPRPSLPPP